MDVVFSVVGWLLQAAVAGVVGNLAWRAVSSSKASQVVYRVSPTPLPAGRQQSQGQDTAVGMFLVLVLIAVLGTTTVEGAPASLWAWGVAMVAQVGLAAALLAIARRASQRFVWMVVLAHVVGAVAGVVAFVLAVWRFGQVSVLTVGFTLALHVIGFAVLVTQGAALWAEMGRDLPRVRAFVLRSFWRFALVPSAAVGVAVVALTVRAISIYTIVALPLG